MSIVKDQLETMLKEHDIDFDDITELGHDNFSIMPRGNTTPDRLSEIILNKGLFDNEDDVTYDDEEGDVIIHFEGNDDEDKALPITGKTALYMGIKDSESDDAPTLSSETQSLAANDKKQLDTQLADLEAFTRTTLYKMWDYWRQSGGTDIFIDVKNDGVDTSEVETAQKDLFSKFATANQALVDAGDIMTSLWVYLHKVEIYKPGDPLPKYEK